MIIRRRQRARQRWRSTSEEDKSLRLGPEQEQVPKGEQAAMECCSRKVSKGERELPPHPLLPLLWKSIMLRVILLEQLPFLPQTFEERQLPHSLVMHRSTSGIELFRRRPTLPRLMLLHMSNARQVEGGHSHDGVRHL